jgi:hypothetical protein
LVERALLKVWFRKDAWVNKLIVITYPFDA